MTPEKHKINTITIKNLYNYVIVESASFLGDSLDSVIYRYRCIDNSLKYLANHLFDNEEIEVYHNHCKLLLNMLSEFNNYLKRIYDAKIPIPSGFFDCQDDKLYREILFNQLIVFESFTLLVKGEDAVDVYKQEFQSNRLSKC